MAIDESGLLASLHAGIFQDPPWGDFLDGLRTRTKAAHVALSFRLPGEGMLDLSAGEGAPLRQVRERFVDDVLRYREMRADRVYALEELIDPGDPQHRLFVDDLSRRWGIVQSRIMRVAEPGGTEAWLSCAGPGGAGWAATGAVMAALAPHLRIALATYAALERERFRAAVTAEALGRLNFGWLSLDERCRVVDASPDIDAFLNRSGVLRRGRYDRLTPSDPLVDRELAGLVRAFAREPARRPTAINASRDPLVDLLVRPVRDRPLGPAAPPVAIVYVSGDRLSQADRCDQLVDLFGLLPSEARLAWAIAQGLPIAEAAVELGLTVETARTYSKRIYAKTGARGQPELVRMILTSVLALA